MYLRLINTKNKHFFIATFKVYLFPFEQKKIVSIFQVVGNKNVNLFTRVSFVIIPVIKMSLFSRYTPSMPQRMLFSDMQLDQCLDSDHICFRENGNVCNCSNFLDVEWLSSSGNSCEEETYER